MLIDFHTHCFPPKIAGKAIEKLAHASGGFIPNTDGTVDSLRARMREDGIAVAVVLSIATNAHQQRAVNDFAISIDNKQDIFAFGSVYPYSEDAFSELERIKEAGLLGVKLHPDYQGFAVDDTRWKPLYRKISELGLITVFHAGLDYGFPPPYNAMPRALRQAAEWFQTPVIAAHWGGINCGDGVLEYLCGTENVYFDCSFGYSMMPRYYAEKILEKHGVDRMLFGTDSPWRTAEQEMRLLDNLGLSAEDMEKITHKNAERLLKI